ncbi:MAG: hypothetical protein ACPKM0_08525 [Pleomorphochaeta sp.]
MKHKFKYIYLLIILTTLFSCKNVEVISITQKQTQISEIRDYILKQSIYNLDLTTYNSLELIDIIGESYDYLDLLRNEIPYLNNNLVKFEKQIHLSYKKSLLEIQQILLTYSNKVDYPLIYPNVENKYIINTKSSTVLFNQYRDEIYLEIENVLNNNLEEVSSIYTSTAIEYNIYNKGLDNLNRKSLPTISTNIMVRLKTLFIKQLLSDLSNNENDIGLLYKQLDPTTITIIRD